ncbi:MAG: iron-sulfur cluster assembly accessory protein [Halobacteria archaeon]
MADGPPQLPPGLTPEDLRQMAASVPADPVVPGRPVTGTMRLGDILAAYPAAAAVVSKYGLHCSGCHANVLDTLEVGARGHGLGEVEIKAMVWEINQVARGKEVSPAPAAAAPAKASAFCSFIGNPDSINLSDGAAARLREALVRRQRPRHGIRIGIHKEGPAGYIYYMDFERKPKKGDAVFKEKGFRFFVDASIEKFIRGIHLDYESGFEGEGFRLTNPNLSNADFLKRRAEAPLPLLEAAPGGGPADAPSPSRSEPEVNGVPAELAPQRYRNLGL